MRPAIMRLLVIVGSVALVGAGCAQDDSVTEVANEEPAAATGEAASDRDEVDPEQTAAQDETAGHDETSDPDEPADHDDATDHDETGDHDDASNHDEAADLDGADMVVEVVMSEFAFEMNDLVVPVGSTVRFDFVNVGAIEHEAMFGDAHQQEEFAELGNHGDDHGDVGGHHGEVQAITLDADGSGSLTMTFDEAGKTMIGCHLPGHWDAGMSATFIVA